MQQDLQTGLAQSVTLEMSDWRNLQSRAAYEKGAADAYQRLVDLEFEEVNTEENNEQSKRRSAD